jgi:Fe(3+) dicitrate transport protein
MKRLGRFVRVGPLVTTLLVARVALADEPTPVLPSDTTTAPLEDVPAPSEGVAAPSLPPTREERELEVRVVGNRADSLQRVPGSGTVISAKDLRRADPTTASEMLRRVPGVQTREEYGGGGRFDISIRGLDAGRSRRVLMLEDGVPMSLNPYAEPDMYYAPAVERYRAIEVVKGSGNVLFGPQTLAGTVNFVTLTPPDRPTVALDVDGGSYGYARALGSYGDSIGGARYVVQVLQRRGDGFRVQPFDSTDALAKVAIPTGERGEAVLKLGYHRDDADSDAIGLTAPMYHATPRRATLAPNDHLTLNKYDVALIHEQRFSKDTKLKTIVYAYETDRIWRRQDYTRVPAPGQEYDRIVGDVNVPNAAIWFLNTNTVLDRSYGVLGLEPRVEQRIRTGDIEQTLDFGGRVLSETAHYQQRSGSYPTTYAGSLDYEEEHTGTAFAGYLQDRIAFRENLLVTPGIRYEHVDLRRVVTRQSVGAGVTDTYAPGTSSVNGFIPGLGMIYGTKRSNVFGGLHLGWAPPRVTSAISPKGIPGDVHADESINYELGTRQQPTKWLRGEVTGFLSNFSNQVIANTAGNAETNLTDAGATNLYGVESGVVLGIDRLVDVATVVELGARYTYSRATFRHGADAGNLLPYAPEHTVSANFDVEHPSGAAGEITYTFVGPQFSDADNTRAEDITGRIGLIDSRHLVDATLRYKHKPSNITLRLTVKNLLDATYIAARRPEGIFTGPYRQILVGLRWDWEGDAHE